MGHTNQTANYNLPQFVGTDKPSWLGDINDAFAAIDTAIAAAASEASTADGKADTLTTTVSGHTTQIGTLQNTVTTQGNTLNTVTSLIGNGTPTTTDQTIIGAINELNAKEGNLSDLTTTDKSSLVAAINEAAQGGGGTITLSHKTITGTTNAEGSMAVQTTDIDPASHIIVAAFPKRNYQSAFSGAYQVDIGWNADGTAYLATATQVSSGDTKVTPVSSQAIAFEIYYT